MEMAWMNPLGKKYIDPNQFFWLSWWYETGFGINFELIQFS